VSLACYEEVIAKICGLAAAGYEKTTPPMEFSLYAALELNDFFLKRFNYHDNPFYRRLFCREQTIAYFAFRLLRQPE